MSRVDLDRVRDWPSVKFPVAGTSLRLLLDTRRLHDTVENILAEINDAKREISSRQVKSGKSDHLRLIWSK
jgi:hypothetical protein